MAALALRHCADVPTKKNLPSDEKLAALRKSDPTRGWQSLDDRRVCILCDRTFSGRQVEGSISPMGRVRLKCPTDGCTGTPREWVRPGNPLVSKAAWEDWSRVLEGGKAPRPRITTKTAAGAGYL